MTMNPVESPPREMSADEIRALHDEYMPPAVANYYEEPLPLVKGRGMYLTDADGIEYLDFFGGILTVSVGHCNPEAVSYTHLRAHETRHDLVCRLLLEKKKKKCTESTVGCC